MNAFRYDAQQIKEQARLIRRNVITLNSGSPAGGHTGADLSETDILATLYFRILDISPERIEDPARDIYIQSKGHGSVVCIAVWPRPGISPKRGCLNISTSIRAFRATRFGKKRRASSSIPVRWVTVCRLRWAWRWRRKCPGAANEFMC
ncbi:hypothetical protein PSA5_06115 [Pseudomonas syringae pv. actinidiae]|nr:hypothetical protein PSA5_06115 [Pseudomonas syringae pv. actinidiae]